ncbi:MAG TPA: molybdopterin-dependent oxidoreductase [Thermomicrobiales bacterium]|nr:molybdopterin-dependent oxidoreductase [Thermomicrobiales bacterium]
MPIVVLSLEFPLWLRLTHYINLLFIGLLIRSGIQILAAHPRLYWNNGCTPRTEWLKFTKKVVPTEPGVIYTAHEDQIAVSPLLGMPGEKNLGMGRHWHGVSNTLWLLNGVIYVLLLFTTGEWQRLIPTSWSIFPGAWHSLLIYLRFQIPPLSAFQPYDPLQQLTYAFVVFILAPAMLLTGAAMSPAIAASAPWYIKLLGGRQVARSLHFLGMAAFALFTVLHTALVLRVHFRENIANIVLGGPRANFGLAVAIAVAALLLVFAFYVWSTWYSLGHPRRVQVALDHLEAPVRRLILHNLASGQHYPPSAVSPYFWVNGAPPVAEESPEYAALLCDDFRDWRLEVGGLVRRPLSLSLGDLRALPAQEQTTLHNCVQGWSGVGTWKGVNVSDLLARCEPLPGARYLKFTSYGLDQLTYGGKPRRPFYEVLDMLLATHPQTILAYDFNGAPLPVAHGAPLRLRVETQLGYKMVKYLRSIELVAEYHTSGDGQGGSREDTMFYGRGAEI